MEYNNQDSTYLYPRTAFYVEVDGQNGLWMNGEPAADQTEYDSVSPKGLGTYVHGLTNAVNTYAYRHNEPEPERLPSHQPVTTDPYGSIAHAEAELKKTENAVNNKGLSAGKSAGFKTRATGPLMDPKEAQAIADAKAEVEGPKEEEKDTKNQVETPKTEAKEAKPEAAPKDDAKMQMSQIGDYSQGEIDAPPKGFSKIQSVKGPEQGAPIGAAVHAISVQGGEPYARTHYALEPEKGVQHQPVLFREDKRIKDDQAMPKT